MIFLKTISNRLTCSNTILFFCLCISIASWYYISTSHIIDISTEKRFCDIYQREFKILKDSFLLQWIDTKEFALAPPPYGSTLPSSVEEYLKDPINWVYNDSNAKRGLGKQHNHRKELVLGVVKKMSKFKIIKILRINKPLFGIRIHIYALLDDFEYNDILFDVTSLIKNQWEVDHKDAIPILDPELVQEVSP